MLTGILIIVAIGLLAVLSHRRSRLENKIYNNVPLNDWLTVLILPIMFYLGWFFIVKNILERSYIPRLPFEDFDILAITTLFMVYGFVGNSIHFTGKILWKYLKESKHSMAYKVNEMFHGKLSHYLVYLNMVFIMFLLAILELNHPLPLNISRINFIVIILAGIVFGLSGRRAVFYTNEWFGGYNKPLFFLSAFLLSILFVLHKTYKLSYFSYPVNLFAISMGISFIATFVVRQFFIFARLGNKRKLRFLAKILSV